MCKKWICALLLLPWLQASQAAFTPQQLAIVINDQDKLSQQIGDYYREKRGIPAQNVLHVSFPVQGNLPADQFQPQYKKMLAQLPTGIQAFALTWVQPFRVDCISITSAFSSGYAAEKCAVRKGNLPCGITPQSPYFASESRDPWLDYKMRLAMVVAGKDFEGAKALIDRGIASDHTQPKGTAYLLSTSDKARNTRAKLFPSRLPEFPQFQIKIEQADSIAGRQDVMFYLTGLKEVNDLDKNQYLPGAIADHLTSAGGQPFVRTQMPAWRWIEAGATGSFGTVVEPCNYTSKFPHPILVMSRYLSGDTLVEAYWKSVAWPSEGIFLGEPLARPFGH